MTPMQESILGKEISVESTFCASGNHLICRMPRDAFDVLAMFHHDAHAFEIGIWLN